MKTVRKNNLFRWTLRGKPYLLLCLGSVLLLILVLGVVAI